MLQLIQLIIEDLAGFSRFRSCHAHYCIHVVKTLIQGSSHFFTNCLLQIQNRWPTKLRIIDINDDNFNESIRYYRFTTPPARVN